MGAKQDSQSFIARIWLESGRNGEVSWRGRIKHVQSNKESHFSDLDRMREFIEEVSGVPAPGGRSENLAADETN